MDLEGARAPQFFRRSPLAPGLTRRRRPQLLAASALWLALFIPFIHVLHHRDYSAGSILVDRLQSWRTYSEIQPLRSAVELGTTLSVIFWTLRVTGVLTVAEPAGPWTPEAAGRAAGSAAARSSRSHRAGPR